MTDLPLWQVSHLLRGSVTPKKARPDRPPVESPYLDIDQAAEYCRLSTSTIYHQRRHIERVPGAGRKLLFTKEALDTWLHSRRKRPR